MSEIVDGIWVGCERVARNSGFLSRNGFDLIISFEEFPINDHRLSIKRLHFSMLDCEKELPNFGDKLTRAVLVIDAAVKSGQKVLLHCSAGKSRSVSVMIAYLMIIKQMTFDGALALVQERRPIACPNEAFVNFFQTQSLPIIVPIKGFKLKG